MKVFNLACAQDHRFEGWFASEAEYERQHAQALVECPLCGSHDIRKLLSAPRLNLSPRQSDTAAPSASAREGRSPGPGLSELQALWIQMARHIVANTEDVGERFAEEARRMHYDETEHRGIRGVASAEETAALADEGIEVMAFPLPDLAKGPVQ